MGISAKKPFSYSEVQFGLRAKKRAITDNPCYSENIRKSLDSGSVILSRLTELNSHFSVICAIDDYRCFLFDSGIRKFVRKSTLLSVSSPPILIEINTV